MHNFYDRWTNRTTNELTDRETDFSIEIEGCLTENLLMINNPQFCPNHADIQ